MAKKNAIDGTDTQVEEADMAAGDIIDTEGNISGPEEGAHGVVETAGVSGKAKRIKCVIQNQAGEVGKQPVFVRMLTEHGSYEAWIPRNTQVEIPEYVYDFLSQSDGYELVSEQVNGRTEMVQKPVNRYIIQRV